MASWPALPYEEWSDTLGTLHMILQILGKVRVALSPAEPDWAHIVLYVTTRGLTTGPVPSNVGLFDVEADLLHHQVVIRTTDGATELVALRARPVAAFWIDFNAALRKLGIETDLSQEPQEVPDPIPFPDDTTHTAYDADAATRFWRVLSVLEPVFASYRAEYRGRVSRVQLFWGHTDLNVTRFTCDAQQMSVGWWPGDETFRKPAFYAYGDPKPEGIDTADLGVTGARWDAELGEFLLDYDDVRAARSPEAHLRQFLDAAYEACATRSHWDPGLVTRAHT